MSAAKTPGSRPGTPRERRGGRRVWLALGCCLGFVVLVALGGCSSLQSSSSEVGAAQVTAAGVTLSPPEGWVVQQEDTGLVLAAREVDLTADVPQGARVVVERASGVPLDADAEVPLLGVEAAEDVASLEVLEEPAVVTVGDLEGVAIGLREGGIVRRYIVVNAGGDQVYMVTLEAPAGQWEEHGSTWDAILASVAFAEE